MCFTLIAHEIESDICHDVLSALHDAWEIGESTYFVPSVYRKSVKKPLATPSPAKLKLNLKNRRNLTPFYPASPLDARGFEDDDEADQAARVAAEAMRAAQEASNSSAYPQMLEAAEAAAVAAEAAKDEAKKRFKKYRA